MAQERVTWLADVLRAAGLTVVEYRGWKTRSRPAASGGFAPKGIVVHHDGSKAGPSPSLAKYIAETGRKGTPAPLSQLWLDTNGTWYVLAAGRANHAGLGAGWGTIRANKGNEDAIGIEADHTSGEKWSAKQYTSYVKGVAALCRHMHLNPMKSVAGHKEYAPGRKDDPSFDMGKFRKDVVAMMKPPVKPKPKPKPPVKPVPVKPKPPVKKKFPLPAGHVFGRKTSKTVHNGNKSKTDEANVKLIQAKLGVKTTGFFGPITDARVRAWQLRRKMKPSGTVGLQEWRALGF